MLWVGNCDQHQYTGLPGEAAKMKEGVCGREGRWGVREQGVVDFQEVLM